MPENKFKNDTIEYQNFNQINNTIKHSNLKPFQKIAYYFLIILMIFFLFIFITILVLLIRKQILKFLEKLRRIKLQNEINKIMMIDIFETTSPSLESPNTEFHSISNDSSLSDISNSSSSNNVLSEINIHNENNSSRVSNDN